MARSDPKRAPAAPTPAQSVVRHAAIVASLRASTAPQMPPRQHVQFKLTAKQRDDMIADMQDTCRPNLAGRGL